jgi:hypothetical protein
MHAAVLAAVEKGTASQRREHLLTALAKDS